MRNFIAIGNTMAVIAAATIKSGDGLLQGAIFGVAAHDAASGDELIINVGGVYELPKAPSQAWTVGAKVFWDATAKVTTTVGTDNTLIGVVYQAVTNAAGNTLGQVRLNGVAV